MTGHDADHSSFNTVAILAQGTSWAVAVTQAFCCGWYMRTYISFETRKKNYPIRYLRNLGQVVGASAAHLYPWAGGGVPFALCRQLPKRYPRNRCIYSLLCIGATSHPFIPYFCCHRYHALCFRISTRNLKITSGPSLVRRRQCDLE